MVQMPSKIQFNTGIPPEGLQYTLTLIKPAHFIAIPVLDVGGVSRN
jgi:hypothetical protein